MMQPQIRIVCVEDHAIVREGIAALLGLQPDMKVVACAANGEQGIDLVREHRPDITLMDLQLPRISGIDVTQKIREEQPEARIIILTVFQGDEDIRRALEAGAVAYLSKDTLGEELVGIIREIYAGHLPTSPAVLARPGDQEHRAVLSQREVRVVELVAKGLRNKEIATELQISVGTVVVHLRNIMLKLKLNDRTSVVTVAAKRGIIHLS